MKKIDVGPIQTRRDFCAHACQAMSLVALGSFVQGCGGSPTSPSGTAPALSTIGGTVSNGAVSVTVDASSALASVGGAALVQSSSGNFLVSRTGQDTFVALTAVCTHESCTITGFENQTYVCPCHGSRFNTSGGVVNGPATRSLRTFTTAFANNLLMITL
ncbi:MAG TPA: Rieske (2Fe-2S) protein [Vicinamibacterales bacterium]|nr:Rieske (2Fe-2S) protein [Vicinamibacterales bacterium]